MQAATSASAAQREEDLAAMRRGNKSLIIAWRDGSAMGEAQKAVIRELNRLVIRGK